MDFQHVGLAVEADDDLLIAINEGLEKLAALAPEKAELVKLRFFAGLKINEAADVLGISAATANRHWVFARAWLFRELKANL